MMAFKDISAEMEALAASAAPSVVQVVSGERGAGGGIIWRADGAILTNHHVVAGREQSQVLFPDGRRLPATVVNRNPQLDLALLRVEAEGLPAALVDDSATLRVGELLFAIGHPWGMPYVVTMGIVSGTGTVRAGRGGERARFIRSDVRLAPGNSGGPLLNARGAVVGINAMIFGGDLSAAIPSDVAREWVAGLPSRRVSLGLELQPVELPPALRPDGPAGRAAALLVTAVSTAGPSLLVGDLLLEVAGEPVGDAEQLSNLLGRRALQERVRLSILRGGAARALEVEVGALERLL